MSVSIDAGQASSVKQQRSTSIAARGQSTEQTARPAAELDVLHKQISNLMSKEKSTQRSSMADLLQRNLVRSSAAEKHAHHKDIARHELSHKLAERSNRSKQAQANNTNRKSRDASKSDAESDLNKASSDMGAVDIAADGLEKQKNENSDQQSSSENSRSITTIAKKLKTVHARQEQDDDDDTEDDQNSEASGHDVSEADASASHQDKQTINDSLVLKKHTRLKAIDKANERIQDSHRVTSQKHHDQSEQKKNKVKLMHEDDWSLDSLDPAQLDAGAAVPDQDMALCQIDADSSTLSQSDSDSADSINDADSPYQDNPTDGYSLEDAFGSQLDLKKQSGQQNDEEEHDQADFFLQNLDTNSGIASFSAATAAAENKDTLSSASGNNKPDGVDKDAQTSDSSIRAQLTPAQLAALQQLPMQVAEPASTLTSAQTFADLPFDHPLYKKALNQLFHTLVKHAGTLNAGADNQTFVLQLNETVLDGTSILFQQFPGLTQITLLAPNASVYEYLLQQKKKLKDHLGEYLDNDSEILIEMSGSHTQNAQLNGESMAVTLARGLTGG